MNTRITAAVALFLAGTLALAGCVPAEQADPADHSGMGHSTSDAPTGDANDADAMFASMMIVHHEQAVEMSDIVLAKDDVDPRVSDLAERIKAAQGPEIEQLQGWLDDWGVDADDAGEMDHGDGMMSDDDLAALEAAPGPDASKLFLEQMIQHHQGAVEMAQEEVDNGQNSDAVALAETIIEAQTTEIATMKDLLDTL